MVQFSIKLLTCVVIVHKLCTSIHIRTHWQVGSGVCCNNKRCILQYEHPSSPSPLPLLSVQLTDVIHFPSSLSLSTTQAAVKDKSTLQAEVASLQKTNMNLARGKDVLEARVNTHALYVICTLATHVHVL